MFRPAILVSIFACMPGIGGCVERNINIDSNPSGALVYLNEEEVGRTPLKKPFKWYGNYSVTVRKEGYETLKTTTQVKPPAFQIVPLDFFADVLPFTFKDEQHFAYTLQPATEGPGGAAGLEQRGEAMRGQLETSQFATTRPTPTTKPATRVTY
jgi:hypothetical protein